MTDAEFKKVQEYMMRVLTNQGLYTEFKRDGGLSISLTQFNLSTVYADIDRDEVEYYWDNADDELRAEIMEGK